MLFRSADGGATWDSAPGPLLDLAAPRLAVAARYPADPRIIVAAGASDTVLVSPRFGTPFVASAGGVPIDRGVRHAKACGATAPDAYYCRAQLLASGIGPGDSAPGALLPLGNGRVIYLRHLAGVLCSADGGRSWGQRCPG
jgi:hypothetical protein